MSGFRCLTVCLVCVTMSCSSSGSLEDVLDGKVQAPGQIQKIFEDNTLEEMVDALRTRLGQGPGWYGNGTNAARLGAMVRFMCEAPGGTVRVVESFADWMGKKPLDEAARKIFRTVGETNANGLMTVVRSMDFQSPRPVLPELIAVLATAGDETLFGEFKALLQGYDLAPGLFEAAFLSLSMVRFHDTLNFSEAGLKALAVRRIREEWGGGKVSPEDLDAVTERVRFFLSSRTPMFAVLFLEMMADQALKPGKYAGAGRRRIVEHLYDLVEGMKERIEGRSENEKMTFAGIMSRLYGAR